MIPAICAHIRIIFLLIDLQILYILVYIFLRKRIFFLYSETLSVSTQLEIMEIRYAQLCLITIITLQCMCEG